MFKLGDRVVVRAPSNGPSLIAEQRCYRLFLWGAQGVVVDVFPSLECPIVVAFADPSLPAQVRFLPGDLELVDEATKNMVLLVYLSDGE